jgi:quercetin 2,3-dioxygenase
VLGPGKVQLMSAGTGVLHSEFNPSNKEAAHFLQIWILPRQKGLEPSYTEWHPAANRDEERKVLVISPDGREDSATIAQDAHVYRIRLKAGETVSHETQPQRGVWVQVMRGALTLNGHSLEAGDGAALEGESALQLAGTADTEALLFDLA